MMTEINDLIHPLDIILNYLTLQFGRCAVFSVFIFALIMALRRICKNHIFIKGLFWTLLLITPFIGKMKLFYENSLCVHASRWWTDWCMRNFWISRIYFAGMIVIGLILCHRRRALHRFVRGMDSENAAGTKVFVCCCNVTPFTTGIFFPKIVIPKVILEEYQEEEIKTILLHEKTHIRLGHLLFYLIWNILHVLLWPNPLFTICLKYFRADLEDICDTVTIQNSNYTEYEYGNLLLKSIKRMQDDSPPQRIKSPVTFAGERQYLQIKQRIKTVLSHKKYNRLAVSCMSIIAALFTAILLIAIKENSYANYQENGDIYVYDFTGNNCLVKDSCELRKAVTYDENYLYVDGRQLSVLLTAQKINESQYVIGFGGYQKMPGYGGGYSCIFVEAGALPNGIIQVPYYKSKNLLNWLHKNI